MVDEARVRTKLALLRSYRDELRALEGPDATEERVFARRYLVQAGIQLCIDLANHVIASSGWATAVDFRDAFERLEEHGVLDAQLARRLREMVGMRNRLVHLYDEVDDGLIARAAAEDLGDWSAFAQAVAGLLDEPGPDGRV